jgi:hypothetical protein
MRTNAKDRVGAAFRNKSIGKLVKDRVGAAFRKKSIGKLVKDPLDALLGVSPSEVKILACCMLAPDSLVLGTKIASPTVLGLHNTSSEKIGQVYCATAGFIDLGHVRDLCDLTKYIFDQIHSVLTSNLSAPPPVRTSHGSATLLSSVAQHEWLSLARTLAYLDSVGYEIYTFGKLTPGGKNSSFSPEDLSSNYLGTVVGGRAISSTPPGGSFDRTVDTILSGLLSDLEVLSKTDAEAAFALIGKKWVDYSGPGSLLRNDYLKRRNMDGIPWQTGHAKDKAISSLIDPAQLPPYHGLFTYEFNYDGVVFRDSDFDTKINAIITALTAVDPNATKP